ncbi:MAG: hypothetical protein KatS3mg038_1213 [Candidatus Kapaibacterium sp.]|nr:MAG: hypothetical protein KatS3mg038_1213 [Candidatus Kapabacteria bacterium]
MVAAVAYNVVKAYHLTIERAAELLKSVCATLKQVLARGRRITVKAVTWAVRRYLISLGLVRVRSASLVVSITAPTAQAGTHRCCHPRNRACAPLQGACAADAAGRHCKTQSNEPQATSSTPAPQRTTT